MVPRREEFFFPPNALKMQSLELPFLDILVTHFPNYLRLHYETLFFVKEF